MVFDLHVNEDFEVSINHRGDLESVDGRPGFEQSILLHLTARFSGVISEFAPENVRELARVEAERVAEDMEMLHEIAGFAIELSDENPERLLVTIIYDSGDTSELEVQG